MGGGPDNPALMQTEDDVNPLTSRVSSLALKEGPNNDDKTVIKIEDSDDDKGGVLDGEDVDSEMDQPAVTTHKGLLMRELKALGVTAQYVKALGKKPYVLQRPDYTKPLDEPSWGDTDDDDEESDEDMDADGVLDGEDESSEEDEYSDMEED